MGGGVTGSGRGLKASRRGRGRAGTQGGEGRGGVERRAGGGEERKLESVGPLMWDCTILACEPSHLTHLPCSLRSPPSPSSLPPPPLPLSLSLPPPSVFHPPGLLLLLLFTAVFVDSLSAAPLWLSLSLPLSPRIEHSSPSTIQLPPPYALSGTLAGRGRR